MNSPTGAQLMTKLSIVLASLLLNGNFSASTPSTSMPSVVSKQAGVADQVAWPTTNVSEVSRPVTAEESCTAVELRSINLVNSERKARGLPILSVNPILVRVARDHSREMWEKGYFDHYSPTPELRTPMQRYLRELGRTPTWAFLGENLFYCSVVDADRGHRCLMASPTHKKNILNEQFREIGVGCFIAPDGQFYITQLFLAQTD